MQIECHCTATEVCGPCSARIASLWNAADGMTTEEAEKYLRYGPEMKEMLTKTAEKSYGHDYPKEHNRQIRDLLSKLNREG